MDRWTTFWALVAAAARAVRQNRRLTLFPLMVPIAGALVGLAAVIPFMVAFSWPGHDPVGLTYSFRVGALLWSIGCWYLGVLLMTFLAVAVTASALHALRQEPVRLIDAVAVAFRRLPAILGFSVVASTVGAALGALERRSDRVVRGAMAVTGLSWTLISLFAVTAMANERVGPVAALRRGTALLRATWAEGRLTTLGLGLVWLPLIGAESGALWLAGGDRPTTLVLVWSFTAVNFVIWAVLWLLERVYVAAVYCYAVEGVVPAPFDGEQLEGMWRAMTPPPVDDRAAPLPGSRPPVRRPLRALLVTGAVVMGSVGAVAWELRDSAWIAWLWPPPTLTTDESSFPAGPRLAGSHKLTVARETLTGMTAVHTPDGPRIFLFGSTRMLKLDRNLAVVADVPLPGVATDLREVEALELGPGRGVFVGINRPPTGGYAVTALDWEGRVIFQRMTAGQDGVNVAHPLRIGSGWGVAVGYNGSYGLCLLDSSGRERWCNRDVGNVWVAAALDCDGNRRPDILSLSPTMDRRALGCYDTDGRHLMDLPAPHSPFKMRVADLDGAGPPEIVYFSNDGLSPGAHLFGAFHTDGKTLVEIRAEAGTAGDWVAWDSPGAVRRRAGGPRDIVVIGPGGKLLGVSAAGGRWSAGADQWVIAAIDLDGDGGEEILGLGEPSRKYPTSAQTLSVWSWSSAVNPSLAALETRLPADIDRGVNFPTAQNPVYPFTHPAPEDWMETSTSHDFRHGCYQAIAATVAALPSIVDPHPLPEDLALCETALRKLETSRFALGSDYVWLGCYQGASWLLRSYRIHEPGAHGRVFAACLETARKVPKPPRPPIPERLVRRGK